MKERRNGQYHPDHEPKRVITLVQHLNLELMKLASFNDFDGERVAADLEGYPDLWKAALMGNFGKSNELTALRDMELGLYNVDTLMVLTTQEQAPAMEELAWTWDAKVVQWLSVQETAAQLGISQPQDRRVLRVGW